MTWVEEILILSGVSLDLFATMTCQGAVMERIEKKKLLLLCALVCAWQLAALCLGELLAVILGLWISSETETEMGIALALILFLFLSVSLFIKAWKNERIVEKREDHIGWKRFVLILAAFGNHMFLTGAAFGLLGLHAVPPALMLVLICLLVVILGIYTGYRLGPAQKRKAHLAGAVLLLAAGVDVVLRYAIHLTA